MMFSLHGKWTDYQLLVTVTVALVQLLSLWWRITNLYVKILLYTFFSNIGIGDVEHSSQAELAQKLRGITVQEWQNNCQEYKGFLTSSNVLQESQLFLSSSHFDSDLGDTVLLALSNALGISVIVFSSVCAHSVINIIPRQLRTNIPIHFAYLQYGPGHYNVALPTKVNIRILKEVKIKSSVHMRWGRKNWGSSRQTYEHKIPYSL